MNFLFGIVFLDANAVGTPVLTHPFGAAPEVLSDPVQLINTHHLPTVIHRLMHWHDGNRPKVTVQEKFRLSHIIKEWEKILF